MSKAADQTRPRLKPIPQVPRSPKVRDSSFMEAPDSFDFGSGGRSLIAPARKRKSSVGTDPEDHILRTKAWAGNRGLVGYSFSAFLLPLVVFHDFHDISYPETTIHTFTICPPREEVLTSESIRCQRRTTIAR